MILMLDHEDSFVFTLARYVEELGLRVEVVRVSATSIEEIAAKEPDAIILSPGPYTPRECPLTLDVIRQLGPSIPILGVCLGHQCIAAAYGARVDHAQHPRHGMTSSITHDGRGVFAGLDSPLLATRYHSLTVIADTLPAELEATALADDGELMGIRHRIHPVEGVQFHPESVLTEWGHQMLASFLGVDGMAFGRDADGD